MKKDIQPELKTAKVICSACHAEFEVLSAKEEIRLEVCNNCHPFYTGKQKIGQADGRVEKFKSKYGIK